MIDDLIFLKTGDQVPADVKVLEGAVEVNESLLTGESDNLTKNQGDELFSGSFVTSSERITMPHRSQVKQRNLNAIIQNYVTL